MNNSPTQPKRYDKTWFVILLCILFLPAGLYAQKSNKGNCEKNINYSGVTLCLPKFEGMIECYSNATINNNANIYKYPGNTILACYLTTKNYKKVIELESSSFDDYLQVVAIDKLLNFNVNQNKLDELSEMLARVYSKENWSSLHKQWEQSFDKISFDKPVLLESYAPSKLSRTSLILTKVLFDGKECVMIVYLNMILVKNKVFFLNYSKKYENSSTIDISKAKNDYQVINFEDENK